MAFRLAPGQELTLVNTHGNQVVDFWAFRAGDLAEYLSMDHTRSVNSSWTVRLGSRLVSNRRRLMLTIVGDTSPGIHDTLLPPCSPEIYAELGCAPGHDSCEGNLHTALAALGLAAPCVPASLNLFMNVPLLTNGSLLREPPVSRPGDSITLRAEMDLIACCSACPQDVTPINGAARMPASVDYVTA
jgi:uncharacterized protein YcgI (DUF1989 family)